jgi:hypothetical protein
MIAGFWVVSCLIIHKPLITDKKVIPAKAGIQENTGFPRIGYGAGPE